MQRNCGEDVSSAVVDEWTGRVMQQQLLRGGSSSPLLLGADLLLSGPSIRGDPSVE